jgi:hypothetical protein
VPVPTEVSPQAYRVASWVSAALAFLAAVLTFGFGLAALTGPAPSSAGDRLKTGPDPTVAQDGEVLAADQSVITGTITKLVGTKVEAPPLPLPLTLTVVPGKGTKAEISGGSVAGKNAAITWDGGRPLPLRGQGSIDLNGAVNVEVTPAGASWSLDGGSRLLTPGSYTFGATVAVSPVNGGLGSPKEGAKLDVPPGATASLLTNSDVRTSTPPGSLTLKGPGQLVLEGALDVRTRSGVRQAKKVTFGPGAFEVNLESQPDGFHLGRALLQGPTTVDG